MITEKIEALLQEVDSLSADSAEAIEALRIKYLSKKGILNDLMNDFRSVPAEQKRTFLPLLSCGRYICSDSSHSSRFR